MLKRTETPLTMYTIKVWLTAVLIAPAVYVAWVVYSDPTRDISDLLGYSAFVLVELISSAPTWLALYVITRILIKYVPHVIWLKCILSISGFVLTLVTFIGFDCFWDLKLENGMDKWMWGNALLIIASIWIFKFPKRAPSSNAITDGGLNQIDNDWCQNTTTQ